MSELKDLKYALFCRCEDIHNNIIILYEKVKDTHGCPDNLDVGDLESSDIKWLFMYNRANAEYEVVLDLLLDLDLMSQYIAFLRRHSLDLFDDRINENISKKYSRYRLR